MISGVARSDTTGGGPPRPCPCAGNLATDTLIARTSATKNREIFMLSAPGGSAFGGTRPTSTGPPLAGPALLHGSAFGGTRPTSSNYRVEGDGASLAAS